MLSLVGKLEDLKAGLDNNMYIDVILQSLVPSCDPFIINFSKNGLEKSINELTNMLVQYEATTKQFARLVLEGRLQPLNQKKRGPDVGREKRGKAKAKVVVVATSSKSAPIALVGMGKGKRKAISQQQWRANDICAHWKRDCPKLPFKKDMFVVEEKSDIVGHGLVHDEITKLSLSKDIWRSDVRYRLRNDFDHCIYKKISGSSVAFLVLYVNDILPIRNDAKMLGFLFKFNVGVVAWNHSKQYTTTDSGTEAKYIAASEAANDAVWMQNEIQELGVVPSTVELVLIFYDNDGVIAQAKEPRSPHRSKHILSHYQLLREIRGKSDVLMDLVSSVEIY
ncbi:hypothetical protein Sango_2101500 [Sesamum angolense]|uniref:Uncharacterized protein n=1 Tax=Sesamum angolense TaxID=2727404 RepID=A0AAE1WBK1_9LAMI|nr:hypothetical protein Sango_2101500 [Sesamum angolense]